MFNCEKWKFYIDTIYDNSANIFICKKQKISVLRRVMWRFTMLIRKATMNDIETLRAMYLELEQDAVRYQPEHFVIGYRDNDFFEKIFNSENQDILVAETDSKVAGFSHVMILKQKNAACLKL